jgi:hypothetical protein
MKKNKDKILPLLTALVFVAQLAYGQATCTIMHREYEGPFRTTVWNCNGSISVTTSVYNPFTGGWIPLL